MLIVLLLLFPTLVGVGMYFVHLYTSPQHALAETKHAFEDTDKEKFLKYVDVESLLEEAIRELRRQEDLADLVGEEVSAQLKSGEVRDQVPRLKEQLVGMVTRSLPLRDAGFWIPTFWQDKRIGDLAFTNLLTVEEENKDAQLQVRFLYQGKKEFVISFVLRHNDKNWQIVEVAQLSELLRRLNQENQP